MKLRHYVLSLVLLSIALLALAMPVAADLNEIDQGDTVFVGEAGLDISSALDSTNFTKLAWWAPGLDPLTTEPSAIETVSLPGNYHISTAKFSGKTGNWYRYDGADAQGIAFIVKVPEAELKIFDMSYPTPLDVTDGNTFISNAMIDFKIDSDLYLLQQRDTGETFPLILVLKDENGVQYTILDTKIDTQEGLSDLALDMSPWYWSSGDGNYDTDYSWNASKRNTEGNFKYEPGVYSVQIKLNIDLYDQYTFDYLSQTYTVNLEEEQPELTVDPSSLIRGESFYTTLKGFPNTPYIIWIKDCVACPNGCCSDQMSGECCDQPPMIAKDQTGVYFNYYGEQWEFGDTLIQWCGCLCTETVLGIMPENQTVAQYAYAIVVTDENGERVIKWDTTTCTKPSSYKIHTQRWIPEDLQILDLDRPFDEACVNIEQGVVTINTEVCDEMTDSTYLGETIRIFGTNTDSHVTYLFFKGPCQSCYGDDLESTDPVVNGNPDSFTKVYVKSDDTWEYYWYTRELGIDLGQYTIYATSMPNDAPTLEETPCTECDEQNVSCAAWDKTPFTFLEPTLTASINPKILSIVCCAPQSIVVSGEATGLRGQAEGYDHDTVPLGIWVFGENKVAGEKYIFEVIYPDCPTGEYEADLSEYINTLALLPGTYTVVVQHPMYNHRLDIIPENKISDEDEWNWYWWWWSYVHNEVWYPDANRKFVVTATPVRWSKLFVIDGPDRLAGTAALNALLAGFNDPNIDDNIAVLTFKVESNNALQAGFSGTPTSGGSPLSVQFTDISIGYPETWSWDFGDGYTSTEPNPLHVYQNSGTYSVTLSVTGLSGSSSVTKNGYISVTTGPTQTGTVTPTPTQAPHTINLYTGWNLISTPRTLAIGQNTAGVVFAGVLDKTGGRPLWLYDASSGWISMDSGTIVKPLDGIWIYQTSPSTVTLTYKNDPTELPPTKQLYAGWNLIGFSDVSPFSAKGTLISVKDQWSIAMGFDAVNQQYETPAIINDVNDGTLMRPMKGYWLFMNAPGNLAAISA